MRHPFPWRAATAGLLLTLLAGCGGDSGVEPPGGNALTSVTLTPGTATLFTAGPGSTQVLSAVARDQNGAPLTSNVTMSFTSDAPSVASVSTDGVVTAHAAGTAHITASAASGSTTKTASTSITVTAAPNSAVVTAPALAFNPPTVDVAAGGSVTWNIADVNHDVQFDTGGSPSNIPALVNSSASRTFPTSGSFAYHCSIHPQMHGTIRVH